MGSSSGPDHRRDEVKHRSRNVLQALAGASDWRKLTTCQGEAGDGYFGQAMAGFLRWLAPRGGDLQRVLRNEVNTLREQVYQDKHYRRTPSIAATMAGGFKFFSPFAQKSGAEVQDQAEELWQRPGRLSAGGGNRPKRATGAYGVAHQSARDGGGNTQVTLLTSKKRLAVEGAGAFWLPLRNTGGRPRGGTPGCPQGASGRTARVEAVNF